MEFFVTERQYDENMRNMAGCKARDDVTRILLRMGMKSITLSDIERDNKSPVGKLADHARIAGMWSRAFSGLIEGDILYIQFAPLLHTVLFSACIDRLQKKGVKIVLIIHDLEILRWKKRDDSTLAKRIRYDIEEKSILRRADGIIAHNEKMRSLLMELGVDGEKIVCLGLFDYLIPGYAKKAVGGHGAIYGGPVLIAGNLARHKAGYVYSLPDDTEYELFGANYDSAGQNHVAYRGTFPPESLPFQLYGSFGLVWDGDSANACTGVYGEYMAYNNPHKTSLYLASDIPVIIWEGAALSEFVEREACGITVPSLAQIGPRLAAMTQEEYTALCEGAARIGRMLRRGNMMRSAVNEIRKIVL